MNPTLGDYASVKRANVGESIASPELCSFRGCNLVGASTKVSLHPTKADIATRLHQKR